MNVNALLVRGAATIVLVTTMMVGVATLAATAWADGVHFAALAAGALACAASFAIALVLARRDAARVAELIRRDVDARLAQAERKNEVLNESVIGLLHAVHRLGQRDLTARAPVTEDIVGTIGDAINQLAVETAGVLVDVNDTARAVEQASREVRSDAESMSRSAEVERAALATMNETVARAAESMQRIALLAHNSNRVAAQAGRATETALSRVSTAFTGMGAVKSAIGEVENRIKRLGERSREIGQAVDVINTIAERTHVLALNASMQAAMAGEAGRGFAVVAEEVQRLAESSRQATERIDRVISSVQGETTDAIAAVARAIERVAIEAEAAGDTGTRMNEAREVTQRLVEIVGRIAGVAEEHVAIAQELRQRLETLDSGNREGVRYIAAHDALTARLTEAAARLVRAVGVFRLPASH